MSSKKLQVNAMPPGAPDTVDVAVQTGDGRWKRGPRCLV
jgi:hypothetical protein